MQAGNICFVVCLANSAVAGLVEEGYGQNQPSLLLSRSVTHPCPGFCPGKAGAMFEKLPSVNGETLAAPIFATPSGPLHVPPRAHSSGLSSALILEPAVPFIPPQNDREVRADGAGPPSVSAVRDMPAHKPSIACHFVRRRFPPAGASRRRSQ